MKRIIIILLISSISLISHGQSEAKELTEQLRKSLENLDIDIESVKKELEESFDKKGIENLKKTVEEQLETLKTDDSLKSYEDIKKKIESGEIEDMIKKFWPELHDPDMKDKMEDAFKQLNEFDKESLLKEGIVILGNDTLDISAFIDNQNDLISRFQRDFKSLDDNFRTVYPNIDVMIKSLENSFQDAQNLDLENILEKIKKSYSTPANTKSI